MKKRLISTLAVFLLLATLLCSCAEGLPLSEFVLAFKDQASTLATRVENLLTDNPPLAANGKTDFAVVFDKGASAEVQNAVTDFCAQFQAYSGADLTQTDPATAKGRIVIGATDTAAAKEILKDLSAATYYIGFAENDLLILAHNDVMLCAALKYFCDTYLSNATPVANARDVFWPSDLHYTAPTLLCEDNAYTVLRAESSGEGTVNAMSLLCEEIRAVCGARTVRKSDFNYKRTEHEILLGHPDHPKANAILETLPRDTYYIGVQGKTVLILAHNDLMLEKAVARFLSLFVIDKNAATDENKRTISFPAVCDYYHQEPSILLAENGVNHAVVVFADNAGKLTRDAVKNLCTRYKQLTNTTLPAFADSEYERQEGVFEILVGRTNRSESQQLYFDGIEKGQWKLSVVEDRSISIGANGEFAMNAAIEALGNMLTEHTVALSIESIYNDRGIKENVDRLLYIFSDFASAGAEIPDLSGTYSYTLYSYSYIMQQSKSNLEQYNDYCALLVDVGLTLSTQTTTDSGYQSVYQWESRRVTVSYNTSNATLRVQVSTRWFR